METLAARSLPPRLLSYFNVCGRVAGEIGSTVSGNVMVLTVNRVTCEVKDLLAAPLMGQAQ